MSWISIDGVDLPTPKDSPLTEYDLDAASTGRGESGYLVRERVRADLISGDFVWENLNVTDARIIREALSPATFEATIHFLGWDLTKTMFAGDRHWTPAYDGDGNERWNLTVQLSEV